MNVSFSSCLNGVPPHPGPLDFCFIVHPRGVEDCIRAYPALAGLEEQEILVEARRANVHVLSQMCCTINGCTLHGELLSIPFLANEFIDKMPLVRQALLDVVDYCEHRRARISGLGALIPSISKNGKLLASHARDCGITTGHTYTAIAIAEHVRQIENILGDHAHVAVLGAAGSTGS